MQSLNAEYTYTSQLPFMLTKITSRPTSYTGPSRTRGSSGMTTMQVKLWKLVWHMKDKVNADPEYCAAHAAIRQFTLERWVWRTYWPKDLFPGVYPIRIDPVTVQRDINGNVKAPLGATSHKNMSKKQSALTTGFSTSSLNSAALCLPQILDIDHNARLEARPAALPTPPSSGHTSITSSLLTAFEYKDSHLDPHFAKHNPVMAVGERFGRSGRPSKSCAYDTPETYTIAVPRSDSTRHLDYIQPFLSACIHTPIVIPVSHPRELSLSSTQLQQILNNIMRFKHANYIPTHGWDSQSGLPKYAVLNLAPDAHTQFFGGRGGDGRFERVRGEFAMFRIMFQRLDHGAVVVWAEGRTRDICVGLARGVGEVWLNFVRLWALLRTWAENGNKTGKSENIVGHLLDCRSVWENLDTSGLIPPSASGHQVQHTSSAPAWMGNCVDGGSQGIRQDNSPLGDATNGHSHWHGHDSTIAESQSCNLGYDAAPIGTSRGKIIGYGVKMYEDRDQPLEEIKDEYLQYEG